MNDHQLTNQGALVIDIVGTTLSPTEVDMLKDPRVSGLIFFTRNFVAVAQIESLIASIRELRPDIILYVDQEGGRVQRFRQGLSALPSLKKIAEHGAQALEDMAWLMASEMLALGIDMSFAPVLDIDYGHNEIIADRAFATTKDGVIQGAKAYLKGLQKAGMPATGKHFPGHGYVCEDSHHVLPVDERALEAIEANDVEVFKAVSDQLQAMMTAHIVYKACDDQIASYSKYWINYLRQHVQFKGIVFSDDLGMQGAQIEGGILSQAEKALTAGCDLLLVCNNQAACLELLAQDTNWLTEKSLNPLRGRLGQGYQALSNDPEYIHIRSKWNQQFNLYEENP